MSDHPCLTDLIVKRPEITVLWVDCIKQTKKKSNTNELHLRYDNSSPAGFDITGQEVIDAALSITESAKMTLSGVYCHCGNSYSIFSKKDRETLQSKTVALLCSLEARLVNLRMNL